MTMIRIEPAKPSRAASRLAALASLNDADLAALRSAESNARKVYARRDIVSERQPMPGPTILLSGWACRAYTLSDGRRQILGLFLPGDLMGLSWHPNPTATCNITALTDVVFCPAPQTALQGPGSGLAEAYAVSKAGDEAFLLRHITRLGRMSAYERIADLMLEIYERLGSAGLTDGKSFQMPLTQETLADALGLTTVHVNRTIQALRQDRTLSIGSRTVELHDPVALAESLDRRPVSGQSI
jgi:CRP-like cAMP-binding protein